MKSQCSNERRKTSGRPLMLLFVHLRLRCTTSTSDQISLTASGKGKHIAFSNEAVPRWVREVKSKYGKADTKFACVG